MIKETYILNGLCCSNCAGKIEAKVKELAEVEEASLDFETKKLTVTADHCICSKVQEIADSVEEGITVTEEDDEVEEHEHHHEPESGKYTYIMEGLCCSNCAGKIEAKVKELAEVEEASLDFETKKLTVTADHCICSKVQEIADSVEEGITVTEEDDEVEEHEHHHEHGHGCCDGHDHDHEHHHHEPEGEKQIYIMEGLCCANCAAKIEAKINKLPEIEKAVLVFPTKQLRVVANTDEDLREQIQAVADSVEEGVTVISKIRKKDDVKVYIMEGLCCANCAAKIEAKINNLPEVEDAVLTFATKQLKVNANNDANLLAKIQQVADSIEEGVTVVEKTRKKESHISDETDVSSEKKDLICIIIGAVLFAAGVVMEHTGAPFGVLLGVLIVAYLILGGTVLLTAGKNILKGQVFDENFLMSVATLGAFGIQEFPEAVGVMLFYRIGEYFEQRAVNKSRSQIMDAVDLRPEVVNLISGEDIKVIDAADAEIGDILLVRPGDRIPLDGIVIEGESRIDTSPVTGEPVPVKAGAGDSLISGCVNTSGQLKMRVEKPLEESMVTRILDSVENAAANKPEIDKFITKFAKVYTPIVVGAALVIAILFPFILPDWYFLTDHHEAGTGSVFTALTFLVISCPCALVLSVPLAFFSGIGAASKKNILFKGGNSIEALSAIKAVVMDKTGTITKGNFVVQNVVPADDMDERQLLALSAGCEMSSTHPIGLSIVTAAEEAGIEIERPAMVKEVAGHGIEAVMKKGSVLCGNRKLMDKCGIDMSKFSNEHFGTEVFVALNGKFAGYIVIADSIKEDAVSAITKVRAQNIVTAMLTGDAEEAAESVARAAGIDEVHAKLLPEDKVSRLQDIRSKHGSVMFVGDGINDAPVLAGADVGAAMGSGADAAIEAADVVFMTSEMEAIPEAIRIAKRTKRVSWQNVYFAIAVKVLVMILGILGFANMWLAVFADTGVALLCLLNSVRILKMK